jgi:cell division protein FtsB
VTRKVAARKSAVRAATRTPARGAARATAAPRTISVARRAPRKREPGMLQFARKWGSSIFLLALLVLVVHDLFGSHGLLAMLRARKEVQALHQEIAQINGENKRLGEEVQALRSDPKLIERIAREEMGLSRPGEFIFKLPQKK